MTRANSFATLISTIAIACLAIGTTTGQDAEKIKPLKIGDAAPEIDITHWIKGDAILEGSTLTPIREFGDGQVYVLEFWATWCVPCIAGMPHLTKLQQKYADDDVTIVGISNEPLPVVVNWLLESPEEGELSNHAKTGYTLAADPDQSVHNAYLRASGRTSIPSAIIVGREGEIEWIGDPSEMDEVLEAVAHDKWDRDAGKVRGQIPNPE